MVSRSNGAAFCLASLLAILPSNATPDNLFSGSDGNGVQGRIVGGSDAAPGEFPFFVQWTGCGASLIHEDIVLTAAHCSPIDSEDVIVGAYSKYQTEGPPVNSVARKIVERRIHGSYNSNTILNDFMVMKLDRAVDLPPVKLNTIADSPSDGEEVTVIGLGSTRGRRDTVFSPYEDDQDDSTTRNIVLQKVDIEVIPQDECNGSGMYNGLIKQGEMLCAGDREGGKDACFGDSGAPLVVFENGSYKQVGVVSFGAGCARPDRPGVYARASSAYDWIHEQICDLADNPPSSCDGVGSPVTAMASLAQAPVVRPVAPPQEAPISAPSVAPSARPTRGFSANTFDLIHFSFSEDLVESEDNGDGEVTQFVDVTSPTSAPTPAEAVVAENRDADSAQGVSSSSRRRMNPGLWLGALIIPLFGSGLLLLS